MEAASISLQRDKQANPLKGSRKLDMGAGLSVTTTAMKSGDDLPGRSCEGRYVAASEDEACRPKKIGALLTKHAKSQQQKSREVQ